MVAPAWVVQHPHSAREQEATNRAHGIFVQLAMIRLMMRRIARASQTS
jgi:hypothetical protein